jgi:hypothetical protein
VIAAAAELIGTANVSAIFGSSASQARVVAAAMNAARLNNQIERLMVGGARGFGKASPDKSLC